MKYPYSVFELITIILCISLDFEFNKLITTSADVNFWGRFDSYDKVLQVILQDINLLPEYAIVSIPKESNPLFWQTVEARREVMNAEVRELYELASARLVRRQANAADGIRLVEGLLNSHHSGKRKSRNAKSKSYCQRSKCNKEGNTSCPAPVKGYCEGRLFCTDHSKFHNDHHGEGSTLKRIKIASKVTNNSNQASTRDVDDDNLDENDDTSDTDLDDVSIVGFVAADIRCAINECDEMAKHFCEGRSEKCKSRKFCSLHGILCMNHEAQIFRNISNNDKSELDNPPDAIPLQQQMEVIPFHLSASNEREVILQSTDMFVDNIECSSSSLVQSTELAWTHAVDFAAENFYEPINELPSASDKVRDSRTNIKIGACILYFHKNVWRMAEIRPCRKSGQHLLHFQDDFDSSCKWTYADELESHHYGQHNSHVNRWVLLQKFDNTKRRRK
jgi:hypothetical protein